MSQRANPAAVGAFVIGGLAIAVAGVVVLAGGQLFSDTYRASIFFEGSVNGLAIGSAVKIRGVPIGQVVDIRAIVDEESPTEQKTHTETVIEIDAKRFDQTSRTGQASERRRGGPDTDVRAQLNMQSLVTGQLYVALSIDPDTPGYMGPAHLARYPQIASKPTALEELEATARNLLDRIRELPIEDLIRSLDDAIVAFSQLARNPAIPRAVEELSKTLQETRSLVRNVNQQVDPISASALAALEELETTLAAAEQTLEPGSPVVYQIGATLQEVSQAAQAMRALANSLERQPNAIVFGKAGESE